MDISLDIQLASNDVFRVYQNSVLEETDLPLFIFHHGAGYTSNTFTELIKDLCGKIKCHTVAFDARGHGYSQSANEVLELGCLSKDVVAIVEKLFPVLPKEIVLVGHSMGGSVMVNVAKHKMIKNVLGVCVLDVVEGTAIEALPNMNKILRNRPAKFKSLEDAIKWAQRQEQVKNKQAVKYSLPSQLVLKTENGQQVYVWRTDLAGSEKHWMGWFNGLSENFLTMPNGRLLILAGTERLDKALTIGQMQGKFQMLIFPECGHFIQEDSPEKLADALIEFWKHNQPLDIKKITIPQLKK